MFITSAALVALFLLLQYPNEPPPSQDNPRVDRALESVDALLKQWGPANGPGCTYGASKEGRVLFIRSYGMANLEHDVPLEAKTVFDAGSVAKQFTAAAVLMLVEKGKLSLDDDIRTFLPEMPDYGKRITIDHLLTHTSGLREWMSVEQIGGQPLRFYDNDDILAVAARQRSLNHAPGERWSYTNTGYALLAIIVKRVSGLSLAELTRKHLFEPLHMDSTLWTDYFRRVVDNRAAGYMRIDHPELGKYIEPVPMEIGNQYGAGGLLTTVGDLLLWNQALDSGRLGPFVTEALQRKAVLNDGRAIAYGRGLYLLDYQGHEWVWHGGAILGYKSIVERFPEEELSVVVLCNADHVNHRSISGAIANALLPAGTADAPKAPPLEHSLDIDAAEISALTGVFLVEQTGLPVVISYENGRLSVEGIPMESLAADRFRAPWPWGELLFKSRDLAQRQVYTDPDGFQTLRRLDPKAPTEREFPQYTGKYHSDEAGGSYEIVIEQGSLVLKSVGRPGRPFPYTPAVMRPMARDMFVIDDAVLQFHRAEGRVDSFEFSSERIRALHFGREEKESRR